MDASFIREDDLAKDIEYVSYYVEQEKIILTNMVNTLSESLNNYKTQNTQQLYRVVEETSSNKDSLYIKRRQYVDTLDKVIIKYNNIAEEVVNIFKGAMNE